MCTHRSYEDCLPFVVSVEVANRQSHQGGTGTGTDGLETYNPREDLLKDDDITEKLVTKQGWSNPARDDWQHSDPQQLQDFMSSFAANRSRRSSGQLARDTIAVMNTACLSAERRGAEVGLAR
jgi:hypothetical protein